MENQAEFGGSKQGPMADSRQDLGREAGANMLEKVPSHVGLHGNEMADRLADEGVMLHGVPIKGKEKEMTSTLKRIREDFGSASICPHSSVGERLAGDRAELGSNPVRTYFVHPGGARMLQYLGEQTAHKYYNCQKQCNTTILIIVEYLARVRENPGSDPGVGLISPVRQGARFPALELLPVAVDEMEDIQTMEMARRLFREATE